VEGGVNSGVIRQNMKIVDIQLPCRSDYPNDRLRERMKAVSAELSASDCRPSGAATVVLTHRSVSYTTIESVSHHRSSSQIGYIDEELVAEADLLEVVVEADVRDSRLNDASSRVLVDVKDLEYDYRRVSTRALAPSSRTRTWFIRSPMLSTSDPGTRGAAPP
jgi:hypothetical protein